MTSAVQSSILRKMRSTQPDRWLALVLVTPVSVLAGCGAFTDLERRGGTTFCYATEADALEEAANPPDPDEPPEIRDLDEIRTVSQPVRPVTDAPPSFLSCSEAHHTTLQFIDDAGERVWFSLFATIGNEALLQDGMVTLDEGDVLEVKRTGRPFLARSLSVRRGDVPMLILQGLAPVDHVDTSPFVIATGPPTALPIPTFCEAPTDILLTVSSDDDTTSLSPGQIDHHELRGETFSLANILSRGYYEYRGECGASNLSANTLTWLLIAGDFDWSVP